MEQYEYLKYTTTKENLKDTIDKYGVAIIPKVLNDKECNDIVSGLWDYFEHISKDWTTPVKRNDNKSWRELYKLCPLHSMLFQYFNCGHTQISWDVRQNEKILEIFAYFWKCTPEELLVSFDGLGFNLPPEITNKGWNRNNTWYHTDQSYLRNDFECIQSWITGLDVNEGDATLAFMEKSNNYHKDFKLAFNINDKNNWYKLTKEQENFYVNKDCDYKKIKCPKGSLVFWDSRTIHCGVEAMKERTVQNFRAVIYLCYAPRNLCDLKNLKKKQKAFEELRTTSHWPCIVKLFSKSPRTYGKELPVINIINKPVLKEIGMKLSGFLI
jgi:hypothetical protein